MTTINISGAYQSPHGKMNIIQEGSRISGTYGEFGKFHGELDQNIILGFWSSDKHKGRFKWIFGEDGNFTGNYKIGEEEGAMRAKWKGTRLSELSEAAPEAVAPVATTPQKPVAAVVDRENKDNEGGVSQKKVTGLEKDGLKYTAEGTWEAGKMIRGKFTFENGASEEGEFLEEELHGKGTKIGPPDEDGDQIVREGEFINGEFVKGKLTYGALTQEGEFSEGQLNGKGKRSYKDGDQHEGFFQEDDFIEGEVVLHYENGSLQYKGGFVNGKMEGHGTLMYSAGAKYVGEFVDGNMEGSGKLTWPDGDFKSGLFEADEFMTGKVKITMRNESEAEGEPGEIESVYEGEATTNLQPEGKGKRTYPNGDYEEGLFSEGKLLTGKRKRSFENGAINEGEILDGKWKKGIEPGPMKSKGEGTIIELKKEENIIPKTNNEAIIEENTAINNVKIIEDNNLNKPLPTSILDKNFKSLLLNSITNKNEELFNELKKIFDEDKDWFTEENGFEIYDEILNIIAEHEVENQKSNNSSNINNSIKDEEFVMQDYDNGDKFEGILLKGERNGKGKYTFANGDFSDGIWEADKFLNGKVQMTNHKGYKYIGDYKNGERHGEGKLYDPNNNIIESGVFVNGDFSQELIDWKKEVVVFGKKNGYSTLLGNILSRNKKINFNNLKAEIEDLYKLEKHKVIVEKCIRFIDNDESFLNIEEASCYLLKSIRYNEKEYELVGKAYVQFSNNETIKVLMVKRIMLNVDFDKKATLEENNGRYYYKYYKEDNSSQLDLTNTYLGKEIIELGLKSINQTKKIDFDDQDLKGKIKSIEEKLNLTLEIYEYRHKLRMKNLREEEISQEVKSTQVIKEKSETKVNSNQGCSFEITYEVKLKQEAGFFNTISAQKNAIESGKGLLNAMSTSSKKGGYRERSINLNHNKNSLSNTEAKNYIAQNDSDVVKGVAGSSTINIIRIKKWNGNSYV